MPVRKCLARQGPKHSQTFEPDVGLTSTGQSSKEPDKNLTQQKTSSNQPGIRAKQKNCAQQETSLTRPDISLTLRLTRAVIQPVTQAAWT